MPAESPGPSVKEDERYAALRRDGASKEKAARIVNTDATTAGARGGSSPPYEEWTKDDLYDRAKEIGIDGRSSMSEVRTHRRPPQPLTSC